MSIRGLNGFTLKPFCFKLYSILYKLTFSDSRVVIFILLPASVTNCSTEPSRNPQLLLGKTYYLYQALANRKFVKFVVATEMPCVHTSCYETKTYVAYSTVTPELVRKRHNKKQNILSDMMSRTKTDRALSVRVKFNKNSLD